jgi:hypothetical protein
MTVSQKIIQANKKFGSLWAWNPKKMWRNVTGGVLPITNFEMAFDILPTKIESQEKAVRKIPGLIEKYETALGVAMAGDPDAQADNPDFSPSRPETFPDKWWEFFNSN